MRLLLNAEPFGFGPTAAIAAIMPHLAPHCEKIGYVGESHTLDLQRPLLYHAFHTPENVPWHTYDTFLTALDFTMAEKALAHGLKVAIYDPLTWYWPALPPVVRNCLYIAQNFHGVKERLTKDSALLGPTTIVPPLVALSKPAAKRTGVLLNLGGLQNPFWPLKNVRNYALAMATAVRAAVPESEHITLTTSAAVASWLEDKVVGLTITCLPHAEIQTLMNTSRVAFQTPGLGNIYDASAHALPTIWLPPANDSQGQQLNLLRQHNHADGWVDWPDLGLPITYTNPQPEVLEVLARGIQTLAEAPPRQRLTSALHTAWQKVSPRPRANIACLVETFGHNGARQVAQSLLKEYGAPAHERTPPHRRRRPHHHSPPAQRHPHPARVAPPRRLLRGAGNPVHPSPPTPPNRHPERRQTGPPPAPKYPHPQWPVGHHLPARYLPHPPHPRPRRVGQKKTFSPHTPPAWW